MFIEITQHIGNTKRILNTDYIVSIDPEMVRPSQSMSITFAVIHMSDGKTYDISQEEYQRIFPLLTGNAPAAAVQNSIKITPLFNQAWWDKFDSLVEDWQKGGTVYQSHAAFGALEAHVMTFPREFPADVVTAHRELRACEQGRYTYVTEAQIDGFRRKLIDLLDKYILEETTE